VLARPQPYWAASYSGDSTNQPSTAACGSGTLTVLRRTSLSSIQVSGSTQGGSITVPFGASAFDVATVNPQDQAGPQPTGTVTFELWHDSSCTQEVLPGVANSAAVVDLPPGVAISSSEPVWLHPGYYYWTATYSGDSYYAPSSSPCGAEKLTVNRIPTHVTTLLPPTTTLPYGVPVGDAVVVTPQASEPGGSVDFRLYSNPGCTGWPVFDSTGYVGPGGDAVSVPNIGAVFGSRLPAGNYYWEEFYTGDALHQPSAGGCGDASVTIDPPPGILTRGASISPAAVALTMSCGQPPCVMKIAVTVPRIVLSPDARKKGVSKPSVITLATGSVTLRKRGAKTVRLRLTPAGRRFVATHDGRVAVVAAVSETIGRHTAVVNHRLRLTINKTSH
jgi:Bacterial Ig-like domain (group 3)